MSTSFRLGVLASAAAAYAGLAFASLHLLDPATDAIGAAGSEYVLGPYGPVMISVYLAIGLAFAAIALGYARVLGTRIASVLLLLGTAALVVSSIFPTDRGLVPSTTTGVIHNISGLSAFLCALVASVAIGRAAGWDPRYSASAGLLRVLSGVIVAAFVVMFVISGPLASTGLFGLAQRTFIGTVLLWLIAAGSALSSAQPAPVRAT